MEMREVVGGLIGGWKALEVVVFGGRIITFDICLGHQIVF
jgi:hypothetical protein